MRNKHTDSDDIDTLIASVMSGKKEAPKKSRSFLKRQKTEKRPNKPRTASIAGSTEPTIKPDLLSQPIPSRPKVTSGYFHINLKIPKKLLVTLVVMAIVAAAGMVAMRIIDARNVIEDISERSERGRNESRSSSGLFTVVTDFKPYYFPDDLPPGGLTLDTDSITYEQGVLMFRLIDDRGESITITQQTVPDIFQNSVPQGSEQVKTTYGEGAIGLLQDRNVGSLIANAEDGTKTFILVNSSNKISVDLFKTILRNLEPIKS